MTETKSREKITVIDLPVTALRSFEEHPYKVVDNEEMASLVDSIYNQGILTPITVRPLANGEYEIVSGHRRAKRGAYHQPLWGCISSRASVHFPAA